MGRTIAYQALLRIQLDREARLKRQAKQATAREAIPKLPDNDRYNDLKSANPKDNK